jgi:Cys-tRNA(Pro)/Cys-tRNA(Cys) deacylase
MASGNRRAGTPATVALSKVGVTYDLHPYEHVEGSRSFGDEAVTALDLDPARVFKTLVARVDGTLLLAVVPVSSMLDLKAVAAAVGGKRAEMAEPADAERATGYVVGGISPLGSRSRLRVVVDTSALTAERMWCSAGKRGLQMSLRPEDLVRATGALVAPVARRATS